MHLKTSLHQVNYRLLAKAFQASSRDKINTAKSFSKSLFKGRCISYSEEFPRGMGLGSPSSVLLLGNVSTCCRRGKLSFVSSWGLSKEHHYNQAVGRKFVRIGSRQIRTYGSCSDAVLGAIFAPAADHRENLLFIFGALLYFSQFPYALCL